MNKFFVTQNQIEDKTIDIIEDDVKHIKNVLRMKTKDKIEICNINNSDNYLCEIIELNKDYVRCKIIQKIEDKKEAGLYLHIFQGIPKAEKMEAIIQKTTEIGVSEITPIIMQRCVTKIDNTNTTKKIQRWQKIAEVAAKQSKRDKIPIINLPVNIKNIYEKLTNYDIVLVAYEEEKENGIKSILNKVNKKENLKIAIIIGPEGGISKEEITELESKNVKIVSLGKRILRTETAPIVLSSIIMYQFDEMG